MYRFVLGKSARLHLLMLNGCYRTKSPLLVLPEIDFLFIHKALKGKKNTTFVTVS